MATREAGGRQANIRTSRAILRHIDGRHLIMTSLMKGVSQPFLMTINSTQKRNISSKEQGFTYGFNASPDGEWICYHEDYKIYADHKNG